LERAGELSNNPRGATKKLLNPRLDLLGASATVRNQSSPNPFDSGVITSKRTMYRGLGLLSVIPFLLLAVAHTSLQVPLLPLVTGAIGVSLLTSIIYSVIGFRNGTQWMLIWILSFLILLPFSNVAFWFLHLRKKKG
jgi:hypothetical protein